MKTFNKFKYLLVLIALLMMNVTQMWAVTKKVGIITTTVATSKAGGAKTVIGATDSLTVVAQLNSGTSEALAEYSTGDKAMYYASTTAVYSKGGYKWNKNTSSADILTANNYVGFRVIVASGYKYSLSNLTFQLAGSVNFTYKLMIYNNGGTALYTGSEYTETNYNKASSTNHSQSIDLSKTASVQNLTDTFFVRVYLKAGSTGKYLCFPEFTVTGNYESDGPSCITPTCSWATTPANGSVGGSQTVSVTTNYSGGLSYSSSDETVATITSAGVISYIKAGTTTITATVTGDGATYCTGPATCSQSITVTAAKAYTVTAATSTGADTYGTVSASASTADEGDEVTITAIPASGYRVASWAVSGEGSAIDPDGTSNSTSTTLTVGTANATVTVTFEAIPTHSVSTAVTPVSSGTATAASSSVREGETTTITATPANGNYVFDHWAVSGTGATLSSTTTNPTTLTIGTADATVTATFVEVCRDTIFTATTTATSNISIAASASNLTLNSSDHKTTVTGGSMSVYNGQSSAKNLITASGFTHTNNDTYFRINLSKALAAGDVISVDVGQDASNDRGVWITTASSRPGSAPACALTAKSATKVSVTYTVTGSDAYHGESTFYIYRATANTTYFNNIKVIRVIDCPEPLDAPTGLALSGGATTASSLTFTWTAVTNASSYDVYLYSNSACTVQVGDKKNTTGTSLSFTGLSSETQYWCKVKAVGDGSSYTDSEFSSAATGTTIGCTAPGAPTSLAATKTQTSISLTWTKGANITSQKVYLYEDDGETLATTTEDNPQVVTSSAENATFTGLDAGTDYKAKVQSIGDGSTYCEEGPVTGALAVSTDAAYAIVLHDNNGAASNGSATILAGATSLTISSVPTKDGYVVAGYYAEAGMTTLIANADGSLVADVDGYTDEDGKWTKVSGATLYAKWIQPLVTWSITTGVATWSTSSTPSTSDETNITSISTSANVQDNKTSTGCTAKLALATAENTVDKGASFTFIVASTKKVVPSSVSCQVFNVGSGSDGDLSFKAQLTDAAGNTYYSTNTVTPTTAATLTDADFTFSSGLAIRGAVTLTIYGWISGDGSGFAFRMGPDIKFYGEVADYTAAAISAPTISGTAAYNPGQTITLTSDEPTGSDALTTYAWYKGADWATAYAAGAVQAAKTYANDGHIFTKTAVVADAGTYWCLVTNPGATPATNHNSTGKAITVTDVAPVISGITGGNATASINQVCALTVSTSAGTNLQYQWQKSSDNSAWSNISGATDASYNASAPATATTMYYRCVVSNSASTVNSSSVAITVPSYTVTYDGNTSTGGSVPTDASSPYAKGATVTVLGNTGSLVKSGGYSFVGWNTADDGSGDSYAAGETFTISANTTLYAQWEVLRSVSTTLTNVSKSSVPDNAVFKAEYTATFSCPVGYELPSTITVTIGGADATVDNDYTWEQATGTLTVAAASVTGDIAITISGVATSYTVTYKGDSPTEGSAPTDTSSPYGARTTVTVLGDNSMTKTGSTFRGWTDGTTFYQEGDEFVITANTILTAVWDAGESCTEYEYLLSNASVETVGSNPYSYSLASIGKFMKNATGSSSMPSLSDISCHSSTKGYTTSGSLVVVQTANAINKLTIYGIPGSASDTINTIKVGAATNAYGSNIYSSCNVTDGMNTKNSCGETVIEFPSTLAAGTYIQITYRSNITVAGALFENCVKTNYTVTFANGSVEPESVTGLTTLAGVPSGVKILQPSAPTAAGYVFDGWYPTAACNTAAFDFSGTITKDTTIYAKWRELETPAAVTVSAVANCSTLKADITLESSQSGVTFDLLNSSSASQGTKVGNGFDLTWTGLAADTYILVSVEDETYKGVTLKEIAVEEIATTSISKHPTASVDALANVAFTIGGSPMVVAGSGIEYQWYSYTNAGGDGEAAVSGETSATLTATKTVAGAYYYKVKVSGTCGDPVYSNMITVTVAQSYTLTYNANGGTGSPDMEYRLGAAALSSTTPTNSGYRFLGWNTEADGSGTRYAAGATFPAIEAATILYAEWQEVATITYVLDVTNKGTTLQTKSGTNSSNAKVNVSTSTTLLTGELGTGGKNSDKDTHNGTRTLGINVLSEETSDKYFYVTFSVTAGYELVPTAITLKGISIGSPNTNNYKAVLTDNSHSLIGTTTTTNDSEWTIGGWSGLGTTGLTGTVTLKLYAWYTTSATYDAYRLSTPITITGDIKPSTYTITLDGNGGSGNTESVDVTYKDNTLSSIANPTQSGKVFAGWYSGEGGTGSLVINNSGAFKTSVTSYTDASGNWINASNTTLYAKWIDAENVASECWDGETYTCGDIANFDTPKPTGTSYWSNTANWGTGELPSLTTDVVLNREFYVDVKNATAKSVTLTGDAQLIINAGMALTVAGNVTKDGSQTAVGDVVLRSTQALGTGALIMNPANVTFAPKATVEQATKTGKIGNDWINQHVGTPFSDGNSYNNWYGSYVYYYDAEGGSWVNVKRNTSDASLVPFRGYNVLRSDATTFWMQGTVNLPITDDVELSAVKNGGETTTENMFANSWLAPIDITAFADGDFVNINKVIYIFNAGTPAQYADLIAAGTTSVDGGIAAAQWMALPLVAVKADPSSFSYTVIPSMQGFKVLANAADAKLKLNYDKLVYQPALDLLDAGEDLPIKPNLAPEMRQEAMDKPEVLNLMVQGESGYGDRVLLFVRDDFTNGYDDGWEGSKMTGMSIAPQMYAVSDDGNMSIDAVPAIEGTVIGFRAGQDNNYTFTFRYEGNDVLYLNDMLTETSTRIHEGFTYDFTTADGDIETRFVISHTPFVKTTPTGMDNVQGDEGQSVRKLFYQGVMYIIRGGRIYNAEGARIQ